MEIRNFDKYIGKGASSATNLNKLMPQHPARVLIVGPSGSGKTNLLMNILCGENGMYYEKLYVYAPTVHEEDKYLWLQDYVKTLEHKISKKHGDEISIGQFSNDLNDLIDVDELDEGTQNIIVFDDMTARSLQEQKKISEHFIRGRKKNCSYIYIGHGYREVPQLMRKNTTDLILFPPDDKTVCREIAKTKATRISYDEFMKLIQEILNSGDDSFLYLSLREKDLPMWIRKNFDGLYYPNK